MKVYGLNKKASKGLWVVYTMVNKGKYFFGAYHNEEKAKILLQFLTYKRVDKSGCLQYNKDTKERGEKNNDYQ